jgi:hypothetical protein
MPTLHGRHVTEVAELGYIEVGRRQGTSPAAKEVEARQGEPFGQRELGRDEHPSA